MTVSQDTRNDIRTMDADGVPRAEIARRLGLSCNTVAKYADMEDMSPAAPAPRERSALEGNGAWVESVLEADAGPRASSATRPGAYTTGWSRSAASPGHLEVVGVVGGAERTLVDAVHLARPVELLLDEVGIVGGHGKQRCGVARVRCVGVFHHEVAVLVHERLVAVHHFLELGSDFA